MILVLSTHVTQFWPRDYGAGQCEPLNEVNATLGLHVRQEPIHVHTTEACLLVFLLTCNQNILLQKSYTEENVFHKNLQTESTNDVRND